MTLHVDTMHLHTSSQCVKAQVSSRKLNDAPVAIDDDGEITVSGEPVATADGTTDGGVITASDGTVIAYGPDGAGGQTGEGSSGGIGADGAGGQTSEGNSGGIGAEGAGGQTSGGQSGGIDEDSSAGFTDGQGTGTAVTSEGEVFSGPDGTESSPGEHANRFHMLI